MNSGRMRRGQVASGLMLFMLATGAACAGTLSLAPVRFSLSATQPIGALTVRNDGDQATVVQLDVADWSQVDGKDFYGATADILATPPIFTIPAGGSQLVRVGLRRAIDTTREASYRVFLQEVPPPSSQTSGLRVAMRVGVPVFVSPMAAEGAPLEPAPLALRWRLDAGDGKVRLALANDSDRHVQLLEIALWSADGSRMLLTQAAASYVLAGQAGEWQLALPSHADASAGTALRLLVDSDAGPLHADLVVEPR
jgi:fimbrial chaperone protein